MHESASPAPKSEPTAITPVLRSRIRPPLAAAHSVQRERLTNLMHASLQHQTVVVVAPAGSGKTTMLTQWAADARSTVAWLVVDAGIDDAAGFWGSLRAAVQRVVPQLGGSLASAPGTAPFVIELINELDDAATDVVIVIDGCQHLEDPVVTEQLGLFIRNLPSSTQVVLSGRAEPRFDLAALRAERRLTNFADAELRCTSGEASDVLRHSFGLLIDDAQLEQVLRVTEGWPAGVCLAATAMQDADTTGSAFNFDGSHPHVRDFVETRMLSDLPADLRQFVLDTSVFDRFDAALCQVAIESAAPHLAIDLLKRRRLLVSDAGDRPGWVRYNGMVRSAAAGRMDLEQNDRANAVRRSGAAAFVARELFDDAIDLYVAAGRIDEAAVHMQRAAPRLLAAGDVARVARWLRLVPDELLTRMPALCRTGLLMWLIIGDRVECRRWNDAWQTSTEVIADNDAVALLEQTMRYAECGDLQSALTTSMLAVHRTPAHGPERVAVDQQWIVEASYARVVAARTHLLSMRYVDAAGFANEAVTIARRVSHRTMFAAANGVLALIDIWTSNRSAALLHIADARTAMIDFEDGVLPRALRELIVAESLVASESQRVDSARQCLALAIDSMPTQSYDRLFSGMVWLLKARVEARSGLNAAAAEAALQRADMFLATSVDPGPLILDLRLKVGSTITMPTYLSRSLYQNQLTMRELLILQMMRGNLTLAEIADELFLSINTVKTHCRNIYRKTATRNRAHAVQTAFNSAPAAVALRPMLPLSDAVA